MTIRKLTIDEMDAIYNEHLVYDFPKSEVKSMKKIKAAYEEDRYFAYGMYGDGEQLKAYAFFIKSAARDTLLLDYLAVVRGQRNGGTGSVFLQALQEECAEQNKNLILEVENPEYAPDEDVKAYREKRIRFYERNHMLVSDVSCNFSDNEYLILQWEDNEHKCPLQTEIKRIYQEFFGEKFVENNVVFHL